MNINRICKVGYTCSAPSYASRVHRVREWASAVPSAAELRLLAMITVRISLYNLSAITLLH